VRAALDPSTLYFLVLLQVRTRGPGPQRGSQARSASGRRRPRDCWGLPSPLASCSRWCRWPGCRRTFRRGWVMNIMATEPSCLASAKVCCTINSRSRSFNSSGPPRPVRCGGRTCASNGAGKGLLASHGDFDYILSAYLSRSFRPPKAASKPKPPDRSRVPR